LKVDTNYTTDAQAIIEAMEHVPYYSDIPDLDGHRAIILSGQLTVHDLSKMIDERNERLASGPRRIEGTETAETLEAFIALVNRHATAETAVFARAGAQPRLEAVIDYHGSSFVTEAGKPVPAWRKHRVRYSFPFTDAFDSWRNAKLMRKAEFVLFVEDRIREVAEPEEVEAADGSLTREVFDGVLRAQGVSKTERAKRPLISLFGSPSKLLQDARALKALSYQRIEETDHGLGGVEFRFEKADKVEGTAAVREFYLVEVPIFRGDEGSAREIVPARLKARTDDGALLLGVELLGLDRVIEKAFLAAIERVRVETGKPVYRAELA